MENTNNNESKRIALREAYSGKWLKFNFVDFSIGNKIIKNYETIERTTRLKKLDYDGVNVIAKIRYKDPQKKPKIIFIANYRPAVDSFVLELPAGLMDNENLEENAKRELKEETGYTACKIYSSNDQPITFSDPWKSEDSGKYVIMEVDGDAPENQNPKQDLESEENIRVHLLDFDENLMQNVQKLIEEKKYKLEVKVWSIVIGFCFNKLLNN